VHHSPSQSYTPTPPIEVPEWEVLRYGNQVATSKMASPTSPACPHPNGASVREAIFTHEPITDPARRHRTLMVARKRTTRPASSGWRETGPQGRSRSLGSCGGWAKTPPFVAGPRPGCPEDHSWRFDIGLALQASPFSSNRSFPVRHRRLRASRFTAAPLGDFARDQLQRPGCFRCAKRVPDSLDMGRLWPDHDTNSRTHHHRTRGEGGSLRREVLAGV